MAGIGAYPIHAVGVINPFNIHQNYPKVLAVLTLSITMILFGNSEFYKAYKKDEPLRMLDFFLGAFFVIGVPSAMIAARIRLMERMHIAAFLTIKAIFTALYYFFFNWFGKIILPHSDDFIAAACLCFFFYICCLRLHFQIAEDFGAAQGFLSAAYTAMLNQNPVLDIWWIGGVYVFLVAILNIPQRPAPAREPEDVAVPQDIIPADQAIRMPPAATASSHDLRRRS